MITITALTAKQYANSDLDRPVDLPKIPMLVAGYSFTTQNPDGSTATIPCNAEAWLSIDDGTTWYRCRVHASTLTDGLYAGAGKLLWINLSQTSSDNAGFLDSFQAAGAKLKLIINAVPAPAGWASNQITAETILTLDFIKTARPTLSLATLPTYMGRGTPTNPGPFNFPLKLAAEDYSANPSGIILGTPIYVPPAFYKATANPNQIQNITSTLAFTAWPAPASGTRNFPATVNYPFTASDVDGSQVIYVKVYDRYYNESTQRITLADPAPPSGIYPWWQYTMPKHTIVHLIGSVGSEYYTGMHINDDKSFTPDRTVNVQVACQHPLPVVWQIVSATSNVENLGTNTDASYADGLLAQNVDVNITYSPFNATRKVRLWTKDSSNPLEDDSKKDKTATVTVTFTDLANNVVTVVETIRLNTRIYTTDHTPLRNGSYYLMELKGASAPVNIVREEPLNAIVQRAWSDIFYPDSHGYPTDDNGELDEWAMLWYDPAYPDDRNRQDPNRTNYSKQNDLIAKMRTATTDPIAIEWVTTYPSGGPPVSQWTVDYDDQQRPKTTEWTGFNDADRSKNYTNMLSAQMGLEQYWVIDATGLPDFQFEFEWFDLNMTSYPAPYNKQNPYNGRAGDILVVYDATAPDCLVEGVDDLGRSKWFMNDSSKLVELMAFTGKGAAVANLAATNPSMNSDGNGAFISDMIRCKKLVLMLYTDSAGTSSGFKLKAGAKRPLHWVNYDVDEKRGEIWVHKSYNYASVMGAADDTPKVLSYDYWDAEVEIDYERGGVWFSATPSGEITADVSYYQYDESPVNTFIASKGDFVEYNEAPVFVCKAGATVADSETRLKIFEDELLIGVGYGYYKQYATWDKDRGYVTIDWDYLPPSGQRLVADYTHHTYTRLSADDHGDLTFYDPVLVAATTTQYPNYTYRFLKVCNEGDAKIEGMTLLFVARGIESDKDSDDEIRFYADDGSPLGDSANMDRVLEVERPWDIQKGTKDETYKIMAMELSPTFKWSNILTKAVAKTLFNSFKGGGNWAMDPHTSQYGCAVWVLCKDEPTFPAVTPGEKRCSMELKGNYYADVIIA